jgi:hypothetical protein
MPFHLPDISWRTALLSFFLGGLVFTLIDFLLFTHLPCGDHWLYSKPCPAPHEQLARRGASIPIVHDGKPLFTLPLLYDVDAPGDVVTVVVPQDLDGDDDGMPDQPVVWEIVMEEEVGTLDLAREMDLDLDSSNTEATERGYRPSINWHLVQWEMCQERYHEARFDPHAVDFTLDICTTADGQKIRKDTEGYKSFVASRTPPDGKWMEW